MAQASILLLLLVAAASHGSAVKKQQDCENSLDFDACIPAAGAEETGVVRWIVGYEGLDFSGAAHTTKIPVGACISMLSPITSINTYGACVKVFESLDCTGHALTINPAAGFYFSDLTLMVHAHDVDGDSLSGPARSVQGCLDPRDSETGDVDVFDEIHFRGESKTIRLEAGVCTDLEDMRDRVSSINSHDYCAELFLQVSLMRV